MNIPHQSNSTLNNTSSAGHSGGGNQSDAKRLAVHGITRPIGLGDVIKKMTTSVGIKACGGCERRAAALNRMLVFTPVQPG